MELTEKLKQYTAIRYALSAALLIVFFALGALRYSHVINVFLDDYPLLIERSELTKETLATIKAQNKMDPRWISGLLYSILFTAGALAIVYCSFLKKKYFRITFCVYVSLGFAGIVFLIFSRLMGFAGLFHLAEKIRDILHEPFLLIFLLAVFLLLEKKNAW